MGDFHVADIREGQPDGTGAAVTEVYAMVSGRFAIYKTQKRLMIQFSDDDAEGANQRAALIPIEGLRSEVDALLDSMRDEPGDYMIKKVRIYEGRLAKALRIALQGDIAGSTAMLTAIKADIIEDRASDIRTRHLIYSAIATGAAILIACILASNWFNAAFPVFDPSIRSSYWTAAAVGAIGAFFSIALAIRARTVPIDLQPWDNITDAVLRIFVGATSAVILIAMLEAKLVSLSLGDQPLTKTVNGLVLAAFTGGFAERLVSQFLSGISLVSAGKAGNASTATNAPAAGTTEKTVTGEAQKEQAQGQPGAGTSNDNPAPADDGAPQGEEAPEPDEEEIEPGVSAQAQEEKQAVG